MRLEGIHDSAAARRSLREAVEPAAAVGAVVAGCVPSRRAAVEAAVAPAVGAQRQVVTGLVQQRGVHSRAPRRACAGAMQQVFLQLRSTQPQPGGWTKHNQILAPVLVVLRLSVVQPSDC